MSHSFKKKDISINTFLNAYRFSPPQSGISQHFMEKIRKLCNSEVIEENMIYTHFGATGHTEDFIQSDIFLYEKNLICEIIDKFESLNFKVIVFYKNHPAVPKNRLQEVPFFQENKVRIIDDLLCSFLMSDCSSGILSSAVIEATYFDLPSFSPLTMKDNIFSKEYMDLLIHPVDETRQEFENAIDVWVKETIARIKRPLDSKVTERLLKVNLG